MIVRYKQELKDVNPVTLCGRSLIAMVGTEEEGALYGFFLERVPGRIVCNVIVEGAKDNTMVTIPCTVDEAIDVLKEEIARYSEEKIEDDEEEETKYYCNNPDCSERGLITEPIMSEKGKMICPFCYEQLDEIELNVISYERLMEIADAAIHCLEDLYLDPYVLLGEYDIKEEEIEAISNEGYY